VVSAPAVMVSGMLAGIPHQGGATWAVLQYVLGLRRLGCEVVFVEPVAAAGALAEIPAAAYFEHVCEQFRLEGSAALIDPGSNASLGLSRDELRDAADRTDLLLNLSGVLADEDLLDRIPARAFVDLDPGFTQLWAEAEGIDLGFARHNRFVTIGQAIGSPECPVPTCGRDWITTPQPVVLEQWPFAAAVETDALTSVGHWRAYGSIEHEGVHYGQRAHSLRELFELPTRSDASFLLALGIHPAETDDLEALHGNGWRLADPGEVAGTPARYRDFVAGSWAELGVAKSGYVAARCGWFSDRSACYLASGRPVVAQHTGFASFVPTGDGLLAFRTADEAVEAVEDLRADYDHHRHAARTIARDVFDSDRVLTRLLECL